MWPEASPVTAPLPGSPASLCGTAPGTHAFGSLLTSGVEFSLCITLLISSCPCFSTYLISCSILFYQYFCVCRRGRAATCSARMSPPACLADPGRPAGLCSCWADPKPTYLPALPLIQVFFAVSGFVSLMLHQLPAFMCFYLSTPLILPVVGFTLVGRERASGPGPWCTAQTWGPTSPQHLRGASGKSVAREGRVSCQGIPDHRAKTFVTFCPSLLSFTQLAIIYQAPNVCARCGPSITYLCTRCGEVCHELQHRMLEVMCADDQP